LENLGDVEPGRESEADDKCPVHEEKIARFTSYASRI